MKLKRLKLRKNNWESETYEFDELLTEFSSQKRVYEVVAKPVVEVYESQSFLATSLAMSILM
jgi:intein/homing endonuclease